MRLLRISLVGVLLGCALGCAGAEPSRPRQPSPARPVSSSPEPVEPRPSSGPSVHAARLEALRSRLEALARESMDFWARHGIDQEFGGVHGTLSRTGEPKPPTDKGLVQQARHLWAFSMWYARREPTAEVRDRADNLYRFVLDHFRDPADGEFVFTVSREGRVTQPKKQLYALSFAIFALSEYALTFGDARAKGYALDCFRSLDRRIHDAEHLGYDQTTDPGWHIPPVQKETNTHIHLLESFTALLRATADPLVRSRLEELVTVIARRILQPSGYAHQEFTRDFTPVGAPVVSYGHDIETAWLLDDALDALGHSSDPALRLDALGHSSDPALREVIVRLGRNAAADGFDASDGGYFEQGIPGGAPTRLDKVWWVQAEAIAGLWRLFELTSDGFYLDRLGRTVAFIERHQRDAEYGEWYGTLSPDGQLKQPPGDDKGWEWKASYHNLRALVLTSDRIAQLLR